MTSPESQESETKSRPDGQKPPLTREQDTFRTLCGPGCSCGAPAKNGPWKIVVMLIVIAAVAIAMIYRRTL